MIIKWVSIVTVLLVYYHFNIVYSKYTIQIDFNHQFDVPYHNHNFSSKMPKYKLLSSVNKKLISNYGISPRYKPHKAKSRSLAGKKRWIFLFLNELQIEIQSRAVSMPLDVSILSQVVLYLAK